jgi:hypothetical protein
LLFEAAISRQLSAVRHSVVGMLLNFGLRIADLIRSENKGGIHSKCRLRIVESSKFGTPKGYPISECGILRMRNAECGVRNEHQGQRRTKIRGYEGTKVLRNAECGVRNAESSECGMLNAECGMNIKGKGVRRYEGTKGLLQCGVRNSECGIHVKSGTPRGYPSAKCGISTDHVRRYEGTKAPSEMRSVRWRMGQLRCGARILDRAFTLTAARIPPDPEGPSARLPLP